MLVMIQGPASQPPKKNSDQKVGFPPYDPPNLTAFNCLVSVCLIICPKQSTLAPSLTASSYFVVSAYLPTSASPWTLFAAVSSAGAYFFSRLTTFQRLTTMLSFRDWKLGKTSFRDWKALSQGTRSESRKWVPQSVPEVASRERSISEG